MRDRQQESNDRSYQRQFFPLVPYSHNLLAALVGGIVGALYVAATGHGEYFDAVAGSALSAQLLLGAISLVRQRRH